MAVGERGVVGRVHLWIDCACGAENEVEDADTDGLASEDFECHECGRTIRVFCDVTTDVVSGPTDPKHIEEG